MEYPTINFSYFTVREIGLLEEFLASNKLDLITDRYTLVCRNDNPKIHDCVIHEILKHDHEEELRWAQDKYFELCKKYPDTIDKVFINGGHNGYEVNEFLMNKVSHIINFAFDNIYKTDKIRITCDTGCKPGGSWSTIPMVILDTLIRDFKIISDLNNVGDYLIRRKDEYDWVCKQG